MYCKHRDCSLEYFGITNTLNGFIFVPGEDCLLGYFGEGCGVRCSGHCIKDEPCDHITGECSIGCQDGYTGARCDKG